MIIPADTPMSEMSTFLLTLIIEDAQAELHKRKIEKENRCMTKVWQTIENFQKNGYDCAVLIDVNGEEMYLNDIAEIYDYENDCGYSFGPWTEDCEPLTL